MEQAEATEVHPLVFQSESFGPCTPLQFACTFGALEQRERAGATVNTELIAVIDLLLKAPSAQSAHGQGGIARAVESSAEVDGTTMLKGLSQITKMMLTHLPKAAPEGWAYEENADAIREDAYTGCKYELMEMFGDNWEAMASMPMSEFM